MLGGPLPLLVSGLILSCCACYFFPYSELISCIYSTCCFCKGELTGCWKSWGGWLHLVEKKKTTSAPVKKLLPRIFFPKRR